MDIMSTSSRVLLVRTRLMKIKRILIIMSMHKPYLLFMQLLIWLEILYLVIGRLLKRKPSYTVGLMRLSDSFKRSEEHTSELQSRGHLVCCLLLDKRKYIISVTEYISSCIYCIST